MWVASIFSNAKSILLLTIRRPQASLRSACRLKAQVHEARPTHPANSAFLATALIGAKLTLHGGLNVFLLVMAFVVKVYPKRDNLPSADAPVCIFPSLRYNDVAVR